MGFFSRFSKQKNAKTTLSIFTSAISSKTTPTNEIINEKLSPIKDSEPELIIIVSSLNLNINEITEKVALVFPKTQIIGLKVRGIIGTESSIIPKSGIGLIAFSKEYFKASVWLPSNSQEHKINPGIRAAVDNFMKIYTKHSLNLPHTINLGFWDSYQNGHLLIDTYESTLAEKGIDNIPLLSAILHPENTLKHTYLIYRMGERIVEIRNGFIFISLFTKLKVKSKISLGLHPLIPFKITEAHNSIVLKLNYKPAFKVYEEYIIRKGISKEQLKRELPFIFAMYQFGFPNPRNPRKPEIRIALKKTDNHGIKFNGDIPTESTIWVMEANNTRMIEETASLIEEVPEKYHGGLVFSSIFRLIRMKNDYLKDINNIRKVMNNSPFLIFNTYLEMYYKDSHNAYSNSSSNLINIFY